LWCGGGHLHKECPKKGNTSSTPVCCNCHLAKGEKAHPANYRGRRYVEEIQKRKSQKTPKTTTRRMFSSNLATPGVTFAAALQGSTEQQHQPDTPDDNGRSSHNRTEGPCALTPTRTSSNRSVSWGSKCKQFDFRQ
jgi:hypothetical protein